MATLLRTNVFQVQIKSQNNQNFHRKDNGVLEGMVFMAFINITEIKMFNVSVID